jgi:flagellar biosynthesis GTPase FlhF
MVRRKFATLAAVLAALAGTGSVSPVADLGGVAVARADNLENAPSPAHAAAAVEGEEAAGGEEESAEEKQEAEEEAAEEKEEGEEAGGEEETAEEKQEAEEEAAEEKEEGEEAAGGEEELEPPSDPLENEETTPPPPPPVEPGPEGLDTLENEEAPPGTPPAEEPAPEQPAPAAAPSPEGAVAPFVASAAPAAPAAPPKAAKRTHLSLRTASHISRRRLRKGLSLRLTVSGPAHVVITLRGPGRSRTHRKLTLAAGTHTLRVKPKHAADRGRKIMVTVTGTGSDGTHISVHRSISLR